MTEEEFHRLGVVTSAYTGVLLTKSFSDVHKYAEEVLGRSIFTHEFAFSFVVEELKTASKSELLRLWGLECDT